jgi:hypothetical protein
MPDTLFALADLSPVVDLTVLPQSSVPAAFDRGHLYSPTRDLTRLALDERYVYDYRPGDLFEPMPQAPRGNPKDWAWWWHNVARVDAPDFLGLRVGDRITIQEVSVGEGEVVETYRCGAVVRCPLPPGGDKPYAEMYVRRRNDAGHWYP